MNNLVEWYLKFRKPIIITLSSLGILYLLKRCIFSKSIQVSEIFVFPVKSCSGMSVKEWEIDEKGLKYDRKWMIVSANNGHFLTQRAKPRMVLIRASVSKEGELKLNAPGKQEIVVGKSEQALGKEIIVTIWKHTLKAIDMGDKVANWLSDFLGTNVRLVMTSKDHKRAYPDKYVSHLKEGELLNIGFADAFPFLLTSTTSLSKVQSWVDENVEIEMIRFRPNIVVSGVKHPFEEDSWRLLKIGDQQFENVKLCTR